MALTLKSHSCHPCCKCNSKTVHSGSLITSILFQKCQEQGTPQVSFFSNTICSHSMISSKCSLTPHKMQQFGPCPLQDHFPVQQCTTSCISILKSVVLSLLKSLTDSVHCIACITYSRASNTVFRLFLKINVVEKFVKLNLF